MRQPTKGPVLKERVWRFIEALLTHAEDSSDFKVHWETDKDTGKPNFVVKTKRRFLESLTQLKSQELTEVIKSLGNLKIWDDRRLKQGKGSEIGSFALKLWSRDAQRNREPFERVWDGSRTDKSKALEATFKKAPLTPQFWGEQDQTTSVLPPKVGGAGGGIDWRNICRTMLERHKRLTTNQLMSADEDMKFELDEIHVPLALVQRNKPDKRSGDVLPEQGSRLYEPTYEEKQRFKHEEFLTQVLQEGKGQSQGRRIALIGEPGAGKTTLLQSIAFWILDKNLGLPIWISLADLQGRTIEEYLLQRWLKNALRVVRVTSEQENSLAELFKKERVWLLLDGVDEMVAGSVGATHASPLPMIASQLEGWICQARVVLSCRLNAWEANINALGDDFETYRLLDFDYPLQVKEFICRWFRKTDADKGKKLWTELDKSERQRIQDLVKNPLRLALLCSTWQSSDKGLPSTKAGLYQQFLTEFYKWKENRFPTTEDQQEELNAALGRLAKRSIDQEVSRFRLQHKLVREELGDPKQQGSLFWLALQLGWLNKVGLAAESEIQERVYAFFHPTFQEYFAALAIADWDFFLPRAHDNHNPKPVSERYRIFEPQWKEVILLWLGRPHHKVAKEQKEEFIKALVNFNDKCQHLYGYRAYLLAEDGIEEFLNCECELRQKICAVMEVPIDEIHKIDEVIAQKLNVSLFDLRRTIGSAIFTRELFYPYLLIKSMFSIGKLTRSEVKKLENNRNALIQILNADQANLTSSTDTIENSNDIKTLIECLDTSKIIHIRRAAIKRLLEVTFHNPTTFITTLIEIKKDCPTLHDNTHQLLAWILGGISLESSETVRSLICLLKTSQNDLFCKVSAQRLETIVRDDWLQVIVEGLKECIFSEDAPTFYQYCEKIILDCAHHMTYTEFFYACYGQPSIMQRLNQADLPQNLQSAIANDPQLSQTIHLICIDGSQFIDPDRPAAEIYDQILDQNCPEYHPVPETMPALKLYWNSLKRNSDKQPVLVFYASSTDPYSEIFLTALSKFKGAICVVTSPPAPLLRGEGSRSSSASPSSSQGEGVRGWGSLQLFTPSHAIVDVTKWIRAIATSL